MRESEYLNSSRDFLRTSCTVSGTGYLFAQSLLDELGGWEYFLLTEDFEFTANAIAHGEKIAYCHDAVFYDEQPRNFKQSIVQRSRWVKGYLQVFGKRGGDLVKAMLVDGSFSSYDVLMFTFPAAIITVLTIMVNAAMFVVGITSAPQEMGVFFGSVILSMVGSYFVMLLMGLMPLVTEWKRIYCSRAKKIGYLFTFPLFVATFSLAMVVAVFGNTEWKPIKHSVALSIGDMGSVSPQELRKIRKNGKL